MSTQWGPTPYFYPIQVAQYGLEHYSKNLTEEEPTVTTVTSSVKTWSIPPDFVEGSTIAEGEDDDRIPIIIITSDESLENPGIFLTLDNRPLHILQFDLLLSSNASFTVTVERLDTHEFIQLHYLQDFDSNCVRQTNSNSFAYSIGEIAHDEFHFFTRNILTDLNRALSPKKRKNQKQTKIPGDHLRLVSLAIRGGATVKGNVRQRSSAHLDQFLLAADWLLYHQDENGGWPIPVTRSLSQERLTLEPGWYSAMGQGHAMSVLCRAYKLTKMDNYLTAARKAAKLFEVDAKDGGIRNWLFDRLPWFEEYPTTPGTFVLNGFIYSLLGLYDLKSTETVNNSTAAQLYYQGLRTLKATLPLFDTGSGSVYDLRHLNIDVAPNLARWDYHAVHIYQLWWLYNMEEEEMFRNYAKRWTGYTRGERAKHN